MAMVLCLDCDRKIELNLNHKPGDKVICSSCGSEFEIVSMDPPEIEWLYDEYDDEEWDDDDDWEDDDDEWEDAEENWSWMIAKRQRLQMVPSNDKRRRYQEADRD